MGDLVLNLLILVMTWLWFPLWRDLWPEYVYGDDDET